MDSSVKKVLVATDLSQGAAQAVARAAGIAAQCKAKLAVLHVIPHVADEIAACLGLSCDEFVGARSWPATAADSLEETSKAIEGRVRAVVGEIIQDLPGEPVTVGEYMMETGNPVEKIAKVAESGGFDLVVVGNRGRTDAADVRLGSVAAGAVRRCPVSVLVAR